MFSISNNAPGGRQTRMTIKRVRDLTAFASIAVASAAGAWFVGAGTALAPEPARLTQSLSGATGTMGAAVYVSSNQSTSVVKWPTSWLSAYPLPEAGKPCSPYDMAAWQQTTRVIVANGSYRKCL
jgi:hypothetical protein